MRSYLDDIQDFHTKFDLLPPPLSEFMEGMYHFRAKFLLEELIEMQTAWLDNDLCKYLDALVDLDYVGLGTLFLLKGTNDGTLGQFPVTVRGKPQMPTATAMAGAVMSFVGYLHHFFIQAEDFSGSVTVHSLQRSLRSLHVAVVNHAYDHGLDFKEAWRRVQQANMQKVRALREADSTRRSKFDVIKPPGWMAPNLEDLCA